MDIQLAIWGTLIALLRRQSVLPMQMNEEIAAGIRMAKAFSLEEAIVKEAGSEKTYDKAISILDYKTATANYQVIVSWTVEAQHTGLLSKCEMAASDYTKAIFKLIIDDEVKWEGKMLPSSLTQDFLGATIKGGKSVIIYGKDDGTGITLYGDISGKETI